MTTCRLGQHLDTFEECLEVVRQVAVRHWTLGVASDRGCVCIQSIKFLFIFCQFFNRRSCASYNVTLAGKQFGEIETLCDYLLQDESHKVVHFRLHARGEFYHFLLDLCFLYSNDMRIVDARWILQERTRIGQIWCRVAILILRQWWFSTGTSLLLLLLVFSIRCEYGWEVALIVSCSRMFGTAHGMVLIRNATMVPLLACAAPFGAWKLIKPAVLCS